LTKEKKGNKIKVVRKGKEKENIEGKNE